ncbi:MAG: hypothetical protein VX734_07895 [Actinomycetota bacterium]|nr:hypothetical protein [Actinomycetota bacterium]
MTKPLRHLKYPKVPRLLSAVLKVTAPVVMGIMAVALPIAIGFPDITIWSVGFLVAFLLLDIWLIKTSNAYNKIFVVAGIFLVTVASLKAPDEIDTKLVSYGLFVSVCVSVVKDIWAQLDHEMSEMASGD